MKTLLDVERENATIRNEREKNIETLTVQLNEAKSIASVLPNGNSLENQSERKIVAEKITHLNTLIDSEKDAILQLSRLNDNEISDTFKTLGL